MVTLSFATETSMLRRDYQPSFFSKFMQLFGECSGNITEAMVRAEERGDITSRALCKAAVGMIGTGNAAAIAQQERLASESFMALVRPQMVLGRTNARTVPFGVAVPKTTGTSVSAWIGEGQPIPVGSLSLGATAALPIRKNCIIVALSNEVLTLGGELGQKLIDAELVAATAQATDIAFIDPANTGSATQPASIFANGVLLTSTGDPDADFELLIAHYGGSLSTAAWIMSARLATRLALMRDSGGSSSYPNITATGGEVVGIRAIVSDNVPSDTGSSVLGLIDEQAVMLADDGAALALGKNASLMLSDSPTSPAQLTSMFQNNSIAIRVIRTVNWTLASQSSAVSMSVGY